MSTISDKQLIDLIIKNRGYYYDDPRVVQIVEYQNQWGGTCWGVTWEYETLQRQRRYEEETQFVRNPRVIWSTIVKGVLDVS